MSGQNSPVRNKGTGRKRSFSCTPSYKPSQVTSSQPLSRYSGPVSITEVPSVFAGPCTTIRVTLMIELQKLRKEYPDVVAVRDLEVVIPEGEVYGLIGPNGAGKTTTIRMACGLMTPTSGSVKICRVDVHKMPELAQRNIGYLSDFFSVYEDLKVWEYLDYFANAYKMPEAMIPARIDEVIHQVGLEVKKDSFVKGLSRGMKQRLGIARAVIHKPK